MTSRSAPIDVWCCGVFLAHQQLQLHKGPYSLLGLARVQQRVWLVWRRLQKKPRPKFHSQSHHPQPAPLSSRLRNAPLAIILIATTILPLVFDDLGLRASWESMRPSCLVVACHF